MVKVKEFGVPILRPVLAEAMAKTALSGPSMRLSSSTLIVKLTVSVMLGTGMVKVPALRAGVVVASEPKTNPVPAVAVRLTLPAIIKWGCTYILTV